MPITLTCVAPSALAPTDEERGAQMTFLVAHLQAADREIADLRAAAAEDLRVIMEYRQTIDGLLRENEARRIETADLRGQVADLDALLRAARATVAATEQELLALHARHGALTSGLRSLLEATDGLDNG